jgi:hypothetical protein
MRTFGPTRSDGEGAESCRVDSKRRWDIEFAALERPVAAMQATMVPASDLRFSVLRRCRDGRSFVVAPRFVVIAAGDHDDAWATRGR